MEGGPARGRMGFKVLPTKPFHDSRILVHFPIQALLFRQRLGLGRARGGRPGCFVIFEAPFWVSGQRVPAGIFYLLIFFCQADSLFSEDERASAQTGKGSWQEAGKNPNQPDSQEFVQISCDLARAERGRDNTWACFLMPSLSAPANL